MVWSYPSRALNSASVRSVNWLGGEEIHVSLLHDPQPVALTPGSHYLVYALLPGLRLILVVAADVSELPLKQAAAERAL